MGFVIIEAGNMGLTEAIPLLDCNPVDKVDEGSDYFDSGSENLESHMRHESEHGDFMKTNTRLCPTRHQEPGMVVLLPLIFGPTQDCGPPRTVPASRPV